MISSDSPRSLLSKLGSNSGSQQPFMSAKYFETVSQQLHHNFIIGFIIIHHNYLITSSRGRINLLIGTLDVMKNLETTSRVPHEK